MQNDEKNRFNTIVTQALNASPYSRQFHDEYYRQRKRYSYGTKNTGSAIAEIQFEMPSNKIKLVLNMGKADTDLLRGVHHELTHVHQLLEFDRYKISKSPDRMSVTDFVAKTIAIEMHARNSEQEGPLLGFVNNMKAGKLDCIGAYKTYAANANDDFITYTTALLNEPQIKHMTTHQAVDHIGYRFMNDRELEKNLDFANARGAIVTNFVQKSGIKNNNTLDLYIGMALTAYQKDGPASSPFTSHVGFEDIFEKINNMFGGGVMPDMNGSTLHNPTLERLSQAINNKNDIFLTLPQWKQALKANDNAEFVDKMMFGSKHSKTYDALVQRNREDGWLP